MTQKEAYRHFCEKEKDIPIFSQPWFIDAVCGEEGWDILMVKRGDEIAATIPFQKNKKWTYQLTRMPQRIKYWGPYFSKNFRSEKQQQKLTSQLLEQLPNYHLFEQNLHPNFSNALPFLWKNFSVTTRYTFTIDLTESLEKIYNDIESNYRNNKITKAEKIVKVVADRSLQDFFEVQQKTFRRQKIGNPFSFDFFKKYDAVLKEKNARKMFFAVDEKNQIHAAVYLIWDEQTVYLHLAGNDPELSKSGAGILLIWHSIKFAKEVLQKKVFDFEGSVIEPITKVRQSFGAEQVPYFRVKKFRSKLLEFLFLVKK